MTKIKFYNNKALAFLHSARVIMRWYIIFSVQTAIVFVLARLNQNMIYAVIINVKLATAFGFIGTGIAGIVQFMTEQRKAVVLVVSFFECGIYAVIFFMSMFIQTIVKGFSL